MKYTIAITLAICSLQAFAQDSDSIISLSSSYSSSIDKKISGLDDQLSKQSGKYLNSLAKQEEKIFKKLSKTDSLGAAAMFADTKKQYDQLSQKLSSANGKFDKIASGQYIPGLDSLQGSLGFLKDAKNIISKSKDIQQQLGKSLQQVNQLQNKLKEADDIKAFIQQRQQQIKQLLSGYTNLPKGISKSFSKYQQEAFLYAQELKSFKEALNDPGKLVEKTLAVLQKVPAFSKFMSQHSMLAMLFPTPQNYGTPQALAGLQTRTGVQQLLQQRIGTGGGAGSNPAQYLQQQMQQAQGELGKLKEKLNQLGSGNSGSSDMVMPDKVPDQTKTLKFLDRIEYSTQAQTQKSTTYFPTRTTFFASAGYKITSKSIIGIGIGGTVGFGESWKHVKITGQGITTRLFAEWKAPDLFKTNSRLMGSLWLTASAEMNYSRTVESLSVFKNYSNWNKSALAGLIKKYSMNSPLKKGKKIQGSMQVLYDFMYRRNIPNTPALVWRVGYNF